MIPHRDGGYFIGWLSISGRPTENPRVQYQGFVLIPAKRIKIKLAPTSLFLSLWTFQSPSKMPDFSLVSLDHSPSTISKYGIYERKTIIKNGGYLDKHRPTRNCYDIVGDIVLFFDLLESRKWNAVNNGIKTMGAASSELGSSSLH